MSRRRKPVILLSNDDGILSEGIQALAKALKNVGRVTVVAPEREQSTMGHALTLHKPVRLYKFDDLEEGTQQFALSGTPADCVHFGIRQVLKREPDLIISGINRGVNLGNDIFYSGTIAAAREGAVLNIPSIAASLDYIHEPGDDPSKAHFREAAQFIAELAEMTLKNGLPDNSLLNVNFPNRDFNRIKGVKIARQGVRMYTDKITVRKDNRGRDYYWMGGKYAGFKPISGSDCVVLDKGYISIMPCRLDLTQYEFMDSLSRWEIKAHGKRRTKKAATKMNSGSSGRNSKVVANKKTAQKRTQKTNKKSASSSTRKSSSGGGVRKVAKAAKRK